MRSAAWKSAYESQMETWRWCRSPLGRVWRQNSLNVNTASYGEETTAILAGLYRLEEDKLLGADPYFVSADMCELIDAARDTFRPEPLLETDLLGHVGFVYFERPLVTLDKNGNETKLGGFSWAPLGTDDSRPEGETRLPLPLPKETFEQTGVALTLYGADLRGEAERVLGRGGGANHLPARTPIFHTAWWFGMSMEGDEWDEAGVRTAIEEWWRPVQTTLRLMQQRISVRHQERPDRAGRRRAERLGFAERDVVVVRLRRERSEPRDPDAEPNDVAWTHRWVVHHHWRNQWYPSIQQHRQVFISDFVKGPEELPLVVKPRRVFALTR